jgi:hypothetical protein
VNWQKGNHKAANFFVRHLAVCIATMGKWVLVQCNCADRKPLEGSRWGAYACGHQDGASLAFAPNDLVSYGYRLARIYKKRSGEFETWQRLGDWRNYDDEYLLISPEEAALWQLEIEQLQSFLAGHEFMGWTELQRWRQQEEEVRQSYARIGHEPTPVDEVLASGKSLCRASSEMGSPIEFFW